MSEYEILDKNDLSREDSAEALLQDWEQRRGLCVSIHDLTGEFRTPDGNPLLAERLSHRHAFCRLGRENWRVEKACRDDCARGAEGCARRSGAAFIHRCWKGAEELVVPICVRDRVRLLLYLGVFRSSEAEPEEYREAGKRLPTADPDFYRQLAAEAELIGAGLLSLAVEATASRREPTARKELIRRYLYCHAHENVTLRDIGKLLHLSPSRVSHLCQAEFGIPFQEMRMEERLNRARRLLLATPLPLKQIAAEVGLRNEFYLSRCFRARFHCPPGAYRRQQQPGSGTPPNDV